MNKEDSNKVVNTAKQMKDSPMLAAIMLLGGLDESIREQEKNGQNQVCRSSVLPTEGLDQYDTYGPYASLGIKVLDRVKDDPLFTHVELPAGWSIKPRGHSMHNHIVDEKGRKRASFFYKASFHDRVADMRSPICRYQIKQGANRNYSFISGGLQEFIVIDNSLSDNSDVSAITIKTFSQIYASSLEGQTPDGYTEKMKVAALEWLKSEYPRFEDPAAYWD